MKKTFIESHISEISYDNLEDWCLPNVSSFSHKKELFTYQVSAIVNAGKALYSYFTNENGKEALYSKCISLGMNENLFNVNQFSRPIDKTRGRTSNRFLLLENYYDAEVRDDNRLIKGANFFNRIAFWMATGSGKSLLLIKMIEYLSYLQSKKLIPEKDILLLLPREDLIDQFKKELNEYNLYKSNHIELINLKKYEEDKNNLTILNDIKVYFYRSDLIRDERKENILDFKDYDNNGNWYILLDEAHRGETGASLIQDYLSILSRNGFLFNFSATFTDAIDYATTCYNFNLEKFIEAGYGKNIYLSKSNFKFSKGEDDFSEREKQKQVLKSLIIFTAIKTTKKDGVYHSPLLVTLVNSINTDDSDLLMFFKKIEEIANGVIDEQLFKEARGEIRDDFTHESYMLGNETFKLDTDLIESISLNDILYYAFNAKTNGKIEIIEGKRGKEIALKLETADKPFALIKIGNTDKFQQEKLGSNYSVTTGYDTRNFFKNINDNDEMNMLLGSRSFYEGWDSNRPNVINYINIGGKDAKKYVLQSLGRGVRIEPHKGNRKRLKHGEREKNLLLETLFVFATDKKGVQSILETMENQKYTDEHKIELEKNPDIAFDLLIPKFKDADDRNEISYYYVSEENQDKFKDYFHSFDKNVLILKKGISKDSYNFLLDKIENKQLFQIDESREHSSYNVLMDNVINHISHKNKIVGNIKELEDEIVHFKHIKVMKGTVGHHLSDEETSRLEEKINTVKSYQEVDLKKMIQEYSEGLIEEKEFKKRIRSEAESSFKNLKIIKLAQHYYLPLIFSDMERVEYIKNIVTVRSEVKLLKKLIEYIGENDSKDTGYKWMFSKINENIDNLYIPYFLRKTNKYSKFYPDFIFWIKKNEEYRIVFVDPHGTAHTDYFNKLEEFERIFYENGKPKVFHYKSFNVRFDLKLVAQDINLVPKIYENFWIQEGDFSFLDPSSIKVNHSTPNIKQVSPSPEKVEDLTNEQITGHAKEAEESEKETTPNIKQVTPSSGKVEDLSIVIDIVEMYKMDQEELYDYVLRYVKKDDKFEVKTRLNDRYIACFPKNAKTPYPVLASHLDIYNGLPPTHVEPKNGFYRGYRNGKKSILGGDDRNGVWAMLKLIEVGHTNWGYIFTKDEEIGRKGARDLVSDNIIKEYDKRISYFVQIDGPGDDGLTYYSLVEKREVPPFCHNNKEFIKKLKSFPKYKVDHGGKTDMLNYSQKTKICSINISAGYFDQHRPNRRYPNEHEHSLIEYVENLPKVLEELIKHLGTKQYLIEDL